MAAAYYEKPSTSLDSIGSVKLGLKIAFIVMGAADEDEADAAVDSGAAGTRAGLVRDRWTMNEVKDGDIWEGEVTYVPSGQGFAGTPTGSAEFEFDFTPETTKIYHAPEISLWDHNGTVNSSTTGITFNGAINVKQDKIGSEVEGVEIFTPAFKFNVTGYFAAADMTEAYVEKLYKLTGTVNSAEVSLVVDGITITFQAGELLYLGATGGKRRDQGDWPINARFAAQENVSVANANPIEIGTGDDKITITEKQGWDYLWVQYKDSNTATALLKKPKLAVINRVYKRKDLNELNFPSA